MFDRALEFVLAREGGKVDDPKDRGGRTAYGITQRTYDAYRAGKPSRDVWDIPPLDVLRIYRRSYWDAVQGDRLAAASPDVALCVFDCAVNSGPGTAIKQLQTVLGVEADGGFGPITETALVAAAGTGYPRLLAKLLAARDAFYRRLVAKDPSQGRFLAGWLNRVNELREVVGLPKEEP